jgi:hypothetical protein
MLIDLQKLDTGFCDRLRQITFCIALAKLKRIKTLSIYEIKNKECPFKFIDYCTIKNIKIIELKKNLHSNASIQMTPYNSSLSLANCILHNPYKEIDNKLLLSEWIKSYKDIIFSNVIKKKVKNVINKKTNFIGIHIRLTDKVVTLFNKIKYSFEKDLITISEYDYLKKNLIKYLDRNFTAKNVFIASDDKKAKKDLLKIFLRSKYNFFYNDIKFTNKFRQTTGVDFLIDLLVLSKSKGILTTGGNVSLTASLISAKKIKIYNYSKSGTLNNIYYLCSKFFNIIKIILKKYL